MKGSIKPINTHETEQIRSKLLIEHNISSKSQHTRQLPTIYALPVEQVLKNHVISLNDTTVIAQDADQGNAFFVADLGEILRQHLRWKALLPRVEPYYAVKCNPDPIVLRLLAALGTGFDCASKSEIKAVLDLDVDPSRIIYANPCKQASFIRYAADKKIGMMTFDNEEELYKIKDLHPNAQLIIRILADDSKSLCKLGLKFGAPLSCTRDLLKTARELGLDVIGVSFHVGSGCFDENAFADAVYRAKTVFDQASELGFDFSILDVGGGFSHQRFGNGVTFEKTAAVLGPAIDKYFPSHIRVIAEPGRYYAAPAFTIATHVIARRTVPNELDQTQYLDLQGMVSEVPPLNGADPSYMYYINDGVYGAFNCIIFDHQIVYPKVLMKEGNFIFGVESEDPLYSCSIWGPTCDSIDCIIKDDKLPELIPGDWLYFEQMGAYTICAASQFNGFHKSNVVYTTTEPCVFSILKDT